VPDEGVLFVGALDDTAADGLALVVDVVQEDIGIAETLDEGRLDVSGGATGQSESQNRDQQRIKTHGTSLTARGCMLAHFFFPPFEPRLTWTTAMRVA
jgi:hypothetical protein